MYLRDKNKDLIKLTEYSKIMGIHEKVIYFITMLSED